MKCRETGRGVEGREGHGDRATPEAGNPPTADKAPWLREACRIRHDGARNPHPDPLPLDGEGTRSLGNHEWHEERRERTGGSPRHRMSGQGASLRRGARRQDRRLRKRGKLRNEPNVFGEEFDVDLLERQKDGTREQGEIAMGSSPLKLGSFGGCMRPLLMSNPSQEPSVDSMRTQVEVGACSEALTLSIQIETL
jgi:hypothetical protein